MGTMQEPASAADAYQQAKERISSLWSTTCSRSGRVGAVASRADKLLAFATGWVGTQRLHSVDGWCISTLNDVERCLATSEHPICRRVRRTLERNGLNLAPRLGAHTFTRMDGGKNSTSTGENSTRKVGAEFGDDFWMAALTDKEAPLSTPSDAEAAALHAMASPAAKRPTASPAVRERDEDALSQASTQRWGITPTSQNISPVTDDAVAVGTQLTGSNLFKSATVLLKATAGENPRGVEGWVPELQLETPPRRNFTSASSSRRASPVAFSTKLLGDGAVVLNRVEEGPGCNPVGNAIVCGERYEF